MNDIALFNKTAFQCSQVITHSYSTSFTLGIRALHKKFHAPVYAIYGFVRWADEIVDTFQEYDKKTLLKAFKADTYKAIEDGISLNPVLHAFQQVVHAYQIEAGLIEDFLKSMEMDLYQQVYNKDLYSEYIYGSAEVVGLMCLRVFCEGNEILYQSLKDPARKLGSAFQKVNFLRDIRSDYLDRGRVYFPGVNFDHFTPHEKKKIEKDIQEDFNAAYQGILKLPAGAKLGVYLAYTYYINLFQKIKSCSPVHIAHQRIRLPYKQKLALFVQTYFRYRFNYL